MTRRDDLTLLEELNRWIDAVWDVRGEDGAPAYIPHGRERRESKVDPIRTARDESVRRLGARWPADELGQRAARLFFDPLAWQEGRPGRDRRLQATLATLHALLALHPPPDTPALIERRLRYIFEHAYKLEALLGYRSFPPSHRSPDVRGCLEELLALPPSPEVLDLTEQVVRGALDRVPEEREEQVWRRGQRAYEVFSYDLRRTWPALAQRLHEAGRFPYEAFREGVGHLPLLMGEASTIRQLSAANEALSPAFRDTLEGYGDRLALEAAADLTPETAPFLTSHRRLRGPQFLVAAVRQHAAQRLRPLVYEDNAWKHDVYAAVLALARAADVEPREPAAREALVAELRAYPEKSLETVLPVALAGRRVVLAALGWERAGPLVEQVVETARLESNASRYEQDVRNSPDPEGGVVDVAAARDALDAAGETLSRRILELYRKARVNADNATSLLQAVPGWNRADVLRQVEKSVQVGLKAYGLLPLDAGRPEEDTLERYLRLKESERTARKFGAQRQANQQAAAQAGLTNLAQVAGFADAERLEWAMEARLGNAVAPPGRTWTLGEYEVELRLDADGNAPPAPELAVRKAGAPLKTVPPALRRQAGYTEARDAVEALRSQGRRIAASLERSMTAGDLLQPADVAALLRLPLGRPTLERLILEPSGPDERGTGAFLLLGPEEAPPDAPLRIAHPYALFRAGALADWQRRVVAERIVQPFKQAFRELYLITPAERESRTYSERFAGHTLDARVAARLLQARGWQAESGDTALPTKLWPGTGLQAVFTFPDAGHFLAETETMTSEGIHFARRGRGGQPADFWSPAAGVPLEEVPPLVFSETMRDADLVVSVAQRAGEGPISAEAYLRRAELVTALLDDLGLQGVRADGRFAYVQGKRARYRVHLGSAAIHIEPGNSLCVVPDRWGKTHRSLFLPFATEGDPKAGEVISKILLLREDDKIKDRSITDQIDAATRLARPPDP